MAIFGPIGGKIVTIGILISVYGALNGYTMTGIRIPYALALDNLMPFSRQFQKLSKRFVVPYVRNFPVSCSHYHDVFRNLRFIDGYVSFCYVAV